MKLRVNVVITFDLDDDDYLEKGADLAAKQLAASIAAVPGIRSARVGQPRPVRERRDA
jgi:hypothetical protein